MEKIRKEKVVEAAERIAKVFEEMELTIEEKELTCISGWKAAKICQQDEEIRDEIFEMLQKPTTEEKLMKILPPILATAAIIISIITILIKPLI